MQPKRERPAAPRKGERAAGVVAFEAGNARFSIKNYRMEQARRAVNDAILAVDPDNRAAMLAWLATLGLTGMAQVAGPRVAAGLGYRLADELAVRHG
jgi:hypothetical protein